MPLPNEQIVQERVLKGLEDRMALDGRSVTYSFELNLMEKPE